MWSLNNTGADFIILIIVFTWRFAVFCLALRTLHGVVRKVAKINNTGEQGREREGGGQPREGPVWGTDQTQRTRSFVQVNFSIDEVHSARYFELLAVHDGISVLSFSGAPYVAHLWMALSAGFRETAIEAFRSIRIRASQRRLLVFVVSRSGGVGH
uniref:Secreted protein n=1 Tax=Steinernema glaseri TaxID=37863 RepID=A0A1I7Z670_9BILA